MSPERLPPIANLQQPTNAPPSTAPKTARLHSTSFSARQGPKYLLTQEDRLLQNVRDALGKLALDDRAPNSPVAQLMRAIEKL